MGAELEQLKLQNQIVEEICKGAGWVTLPHAGKRVQDYQRAAERLRTAVRMLEEACESEISSPISGT